MSWMGDTLTNLRCRSNRRMSLAGLLTGVAALLVGCGRESSTLVGYQVEPAPVVAGFTLTDVAHGDEQVELRARPGGILLVFLGFTH